LAQDIINAYRSADYIGQTGYPGNPIMPAYYNSASPVPAKDLIQISNAVIGENIYIYNALGETVHTRKVLSHDFLIDIGHLKPGVYYLMSEYSGEALRMVKIGN